MTKAKPKTEKPYSAILQLNNQEYKAKGETLLEAIELLEVDDIKTDGLLIVKKGKLKAERKFNRIFKLKKLFNNKTLRIIIAKNLELAMK